MIKPVLMIGGMDASRDIIAIHVEQTTIAKDPDKIDIRLANPRLKYRGKFQPFDKCDCVIYNHRVKCPSTISTIKIELFNGEVQKCSTDETECKIQASCYLGGMSSNLPELKTYYKGQTIEFIVKDLLAAFGWRGGAIHVNTAVKVLPKKELEFKPETDFLAAFEILCGITGSWYFSDEIGDFWYQDPQMIKGMIDLDGSLISGDETVSLVGYCNVVEVIGGTKFKPWEDGSEIPTQEPGVRYTAEASADEIAANGRLVAPPVYIPESDFDTVKKVAENLLWYYSHREDNCKPKVFGRAPSVGSFVSWTPRNGIPGPMGCSQGVRFSPGSKIYGVVVRRIVDISVQDGIVCELEVSTRLPMSGLGYNPIGSDLSKEALGQAVIAAPKEQLEEEINAIDSSDEEDDSQDVPQTENQVATIATDVDGAVILSAEEFKRSFNIAYSNDPVLTYKQFQGQTKWGLAYNPTSRDAYFYDNLTSVPQTGYYDALPAANGSSTKSAITNTQALSSGGWPDIEGIF